MKRICSSPLPEWEGKAYKVHKLQGGVAGVCVCVGGGASEYEF